MFIDWLEPITYNWLNTHQMKGCMKNHQANVISCKILLLNFADGRKKQFARKILQSTDVTQGLFPYTSSMLVQMNKLWKQLNLASVTDLLCFSV